MPHSLSSLVDLLARFSMTCTIEGDRKLEITGVATLEDAQPNELSFLSNNKYEKMLQSTRARAVIVSKEQQSPPHLTLLRTPDPYAALTVIMVHVHGFRKHPKPTGGPSPTIHATAQIGENANIHPGVTIGANVRIGRNAIIYPGVYIAENCRIGDDCIFYPNVVIYDGCTLGNRVALHANTVVGEDGLGYAPVKEKWHKIPQIGWVEIGDDVEIGANCSIDRATLGKTVIAKGTKFSNQVAIGHGARVGENCMFVAQVGIAGSVTVGNHVTLAGKAGVAGHLTIGDNAQVAAMAGVMDDVPANTSVAGAPAFPRKEALRSFALIARLPELNKQIKELEAQVAELRSTLQART